MSLLIFWLGSIFVTKVMEYGNELKLMKDAADDGYKLDMTKSKYISKVIEPGEIEISLVTFIPVLNMLLEIDNARFYNRIRPRLIDRLKMIGTVEEMYDCEKRAYEKNPTGKNALSIAINSAEKAPFVHTVNIDTDFGESEVTFYDNLHDIKILKTIGAARTLSEEEVKRRALEKKEQQDKEKNNVIIYALPKNLSASERKEHLEKIREEMLNQKDYKENNNTNNDEKIKVKKK